MLHIAKEQNIDKGIVIRNGKNVTCKYFCTDLSDAEFSQFWNACQLYDVYPNFFYKKTILEKIRGFFGRFK